MQSAAFRITDPLVDDITLHILGHAPIADLESSYIGFGQYVGAT